MTQIFDQILNIYKLELIKLQVQIIFPNSINLKTQSGQSKLKFTHSKWVWASIDKIF